MRVTDTEREREKIRTKCSHNFQRKYLL
jgi:hypothetical protein